MPVTATCATCDKSYKVSSKLAGKSVRCPGCQGSIRVPMAGPKPAAPAKANRPPPPDDGEYDLAALAAAESAAQPTEERVYIAPTVVRERAEPRFNRFSGFSAISGSGLLRSVAVWFHAIMLIAFFVGMSGGDDARIGAIVCVAAPILVLQIMFLYTLLTTVYRDRPGLFVLALVVPLFNFLFILYTLITSPATLIRPAKVFASILVLAAYLIGLIMVEANRFPHGRANGAAAIPARYSAPEAPRYTPPEPFPDQPPAPARVLSRRPAYTPTPSPNRIPTPAPTRAPDPANAPFTVHIR